MNCKEVKYKIISNEVSDDKTLENHFKNCPECESFQAKYLASINFLKQGKRTENDDFFYSRLKAKMENQKQSAGFIPQIKLAYVSMLIIFAVAGGIAIGNFASNNLESYNELNQNMLVSNYTNDLSDNLFTIE